MMQQQRSLPEAIRVAAAAFAEVFIVAFALLFAPARRVVRHESPVVYKRRRMPVWVRVISIVFSIGAIVIISAILVPEALQPGPAQPIPFSHNLHVTTKGLNCFFCHNTAAISKRAGMPPVRKCLLCHNVIAAKFQPISKIHNYYNKNKAIPWVRVYRLPEFVQFQHQPHIARGFDCSTCHGNVARMDRVQAVHQLNMRFCVSCHWRNKAPDTCFTCHY